MPESADPYQREIDAWHAQRVSRLLAPDGWLSLVGLFWLEEGEHRFGADPANDLVFPAPAPAFVGSFVRQGRTVRVRVRPGAAVEKEGEPVTELELASDKHRRPTVLTLGSLSFLVIERGARIGVRLRDLDSTARRSFAGIERYPVRQKWRVVGRFEPYRPTRSLAVPTVIGTAESSPSPGAIAFELGGKAQRVDAVLEEGESELFIIFADPTNGRATYGAGRFLYADQPDAEGRVVLDFNKAYNPPCAFTPFATCPLPPPQNRLSVPVEAGEKKAGGH